MIIGVLSCVAKQAFGEPFGLLDNEGAIEKVQGLQWGIGSGAFGYHLVAARTIESAEDRVLFLPNAGQVDHPSKLGRTDLFFGEVAVDVVWFDTLQEEAGSTHSIVDDIRGNEHTIANRFGFESSGRIPPEESSIRV